MHSTATTRTAALPGAASASAASGAASTSRSRSTHLTRRGRLLVVLVIAALVFAAFSAGRAASEASVERVRQPALEQLVVQPGDTLWAVAQRLAPQSDPRVVIEVIRRVNRLESDGLRPGQQLLLPQTLPDAA